MINDLINTSTMVLPMIVGLTSLYLGVRTGRHYWLQKKQKEEAEFIKNRPRYQQSHQISHSGILGDDTKLGRYGQLLAKILPLCEHRTVTNTFFHTYVDYNSRLPDQVNIILEKVIPEEDKKYVLSIRGALSGATCLRYYLSEVDSINYTTYLKIDRVEVYNQSLVDDLEKEYNGFPTPWDHLHKVAYGG